MLNSITYPKRSKSVSKILVNAAMVLTILSVLFITTDAQALNKKGNKINSNKPNCEVITTRPKNSKWILKDKAVTEGVRYTTDVYQINKSKNQVTYNYLLKDSTKDKQVIANFNLNFKKSDKRWLASFSGCGPSVNNKKNTLIVAIYDDSKLLKSQRLNGLTKLESIGSVRFPNANHVRVMNDIDLTEEK
jgi:hypothetical protein